MHRVLPHYDCSQASKPFCVANVKAALAWEGQGVSNSWGKEGENRLRVDNFQYHHNVTLHRLVKLPHRSHFCVHTGWAASCLLLFTMENSCPFVPQWSALTTPTPLLCELHSLNLSDLKILSFMKLKLAGRGHPQSILIWEEVRSNYLSLLLCLKFLKCGPCTSDSKHSMAPLLILFQSWNPKPVAPRLEFQHHLPIWGINQ